MRNERGMPTCLKCECVFSSSKYRIHHSMNEVLEFVLYLVLPLLAFVCCCCPICKRGYNLEGSTISEEGWSPPLCWVLLETRCGTRIPSTRVICIVEGAPTTEQSHVQSESPDIYVVEMEVETEEGMQTVPNEAEWDNRI